MLLLNEPKRSAPKGSGPGAVDVAGPHDDGWQPGVKGEALPLLQTGRSAAGASRTADVDDEGDVQAGAVLAEPVLLAGGADRHGSGW